MADLPELFLPETLAWLPLGDLSGPWRRPGPSAGSTEIGPTVPHWMRDGRFSVQVVMWNPLQFPLQPEQVSAGLSVEVNRDGSVSTHGYGRAVGGIDVWAETDVNGGGESVIRFPFSIEGMYRPTPTVDAGLVARRLARPSRSQRRNVEP